MKITKNRLREIIRQSIQEELEYDNYFRGMLAKYGVQSPADLSDEQKSKFFTDVDKGWTAKNEGNAFGAAVVKAKEAGEDEFEVDGKTYPVKESSINEASKKPKFKVGDVVNYLPKLSGMNPNKKLQIIRTRYETGDKLTSPGWYYSFKGTNLGAHENDIKLVESLSPDVAKHMSSIHKGFKKVEDDGVMVYDSPADAKKASDFLNSKKIAASSDGKYVYLESVIRESNYDLMFGKMGNGITVSNKKVTDPNTKDYKFVAHISDSGKIDWKDKEAQKNPTVRREVEKRAKSMNESGDCGCGSSKINEGNAFGMAVTKAKQEGKKEFEFNGKTYKVKKGSYEKNEVAKETVNESVKLTPYKQYTINGKSYTYHGVNKAGSHIFRKGDSSWVMDDDKLKSQTIKPLKESVSVFDERHFGKKGIIIMIDDGGKKVSAIFKDKKNADKYNRNNPSDVKKLLDLAKKTPYPKAIDESINEGKKVFKVNPGIGKVKYSISSHDGVKKHKDGSDFFDIEIFKNKVDLEKGIKKYTSNGFVKESINESGIDIDKQVTNIINSRDFKKFVNYFNSFYGKNGIYSSGKDIAEKDIMKGLYNVFKRNKSYKWGDGDSVDRELVRDELFKMKVLSDKIYEESINEGSMKPGKKIRLVLGWAGKYQPTTNDMYVVYQLINNKHFSTKYSGGLTYLWKAIESTDPRIKVGSTEEIHPKALKTGITKGYYVMESVTNKSVNESTKFYAFFNGKKHEIEGTSLWDAKQKAITQLKVPKSKVGLLAIVNASDHNKGSFKFD
jgi:hypothetical protein